MDIEIYQNEVTEKDLFIVPSVAQELSYYVVPPNYKAKLIECIQKYLYTLGVENYV